MKSNAKRALRSCLHGSLALRRLVALASRGGISTLAPSNVTVKRSPRLLFDKEYMIGKAKSAMIYLIKFLSFRV